MLLPIYQTTRCYNPKSHSMIFHVRENLKSLTSLRNVLQNKVRYSESLFWVLIRWIGSEMRVVLAPMSQIYSVVVRQNGCLLTRIFFSARLHHWFWWLHTMNLVLTDDHFTWKGNHADDVLWIYFCELRIVWLDVVRNRYVFVCCIKVVLIT